MSEGMTADMAAAALSNASAAIASEAKLATPPKPKRPAREKFVPKQILAACSRAMYGVEDIADTIEGTWVPKSVFCARYSPRWFTADYADEIKKAEESQNIPLILILPANTSAGWFSSALRGKMCFLDINVYGHPAIALYYGIKSMHFAKVFKSVGQTVMNRYVSY